MPDLFVADLSDWNLNADFAEYRAGGRPGVFLKATEGATFVAGTFASYRAAAHAAGLVLVGAYHFGHAANTPDAEADHFLRTIGTLRDGEVAILDAENMPSGAAGPNLAWCRRWLGIVMEATDRQPLLYCSWSYWTDRLQSMTDAPLWIAAYHALGHDDPRDSVPGCRLWQYTNHADVPGVGSCDDSVFRGSIDDLAAIGGVTPTPTPAPIPGPQEDDMRIINVTGVGIFLVSAGVADHINTPDQVIELAAVGVPYEADKELPPATFARFFGQHAAIAEYDDVLAEVRTRLAV